MPEISSKTPRLHYFPLNDRNPTCPRVQCVASFLLVFGLVNWKNMETSFIHNLWNGAFRSLMMGRVAFLLHSRLWHRPLRHMPRPESGRRICSSDRCSITDRGLGGLSLFWKVWSLKASQWTNNISSFCCSCVRFLIRRAKHAKSANQIAIV